MGFLKASVVVNTLWCRKGVIPGVGTKASPILCLCISSLWMLLVVSFIINRQMYIKCLSQFCEPFKQIIEPEKGVMGTLDLQPISEKYRWPRLATGVQSKSSLVELCPCASVLTLDTGTEPLCICANSRQLVSRLS